MSTKPEDYTFAGDAADRFARIFERAGRDMDEKITIFVLGDYLSSIYDEDDLPSPEDEDALVERIRAADTDDLADALLDGSHWSEIFADYEPRQ